MFSSVFRGAGACGVAKAIIDSFVFPTWACAAGFNNFNNNNDNNSPCGNSCGRLVVFGSTSVSLIPGHRLLHYTINVNKTMVFSIRSAFITIVLFFALKFDTSVARQF